MTEDAVVEFDAWGSVRVARLIREKPLNSLLLQTIDELSEQVLPWLEDSETPCVALDSSTPRAFCAGADITALYRSIVEAKGEPSAYAQAFFLNEYRLDYALHQTSKPVIVWGQGIVMGGGLGLLGGCSHRIGTPDTRVAMPEITIGLFPDAGGTRFLSDLPNHLGVFAGLTGCQLSSGDALALGLLDYVVDGDRKSEIVEAMSQISFRNQPETDRGLLDECLSTFVSQAALPQNMLDHQAAIESLVADCLDDPDFFSRFEAGLKAEMAKRADDDWLKQAGQTYLGGCPATAAVFLEQMRRARGMSLAEMFRMELTIAYQCARHPDFPEGVRALLVDKDRNPKWVHEAVQQIPDSYVEAHFQPDWEGAHPLLDLGV